MGFFGYLLLGGVVYVAGFLLHLKVLKPKYAGEALGLSSPVIIKCLLACFVLMLAVSALIGRFILHHEGFDWLFIGVNSLVATVVFYFGLNPDQSKLNLPN